MAIPIYQSLILSLLVFTSDGLTLTEPLFDFGVVATTTASYELKWFDSDFFGEE